MIVIIIVHLFEAILEPGANKKRGEADLANNSGHPVKCEFQINNKKFLKLHVPCHIWDTFY